jgi:glyoxylase-like metal-dependent hydrolase (beta-lactamase superfamily II)
MKESSERLSNEPLEAMKADLDLLQKFEPAPDKFTPQVSLFPLYGASPGSAGLLLTPPQQTIAIAGDVVITRDHLQQGQLWEGCSDRDAANESLQEVLELADVIIPGHDNLLLAPKHQWF